MKLEDQVCSVKLAKKLKELGVKQNSLWYWYVSKDGKETILTNGSKLPNEYLYDFEKNCSAFTVAELGEILYQFTLEKDTRSFYSFLNREKGGEGEELNNYGTCCEEFNPKEGNKIIFQFSNTEANSRAKMLIYLLENKLITPLTF